MNKVTKIQILKDKYEYVCMSNKEGVDKIEYRCSVDSTNSGDSSSHENNWETEHERERKGVAAECSAKQGRVVRWGDQKNEA